MPSKTNYEDIIHLPHHVSKTHPPMSMDDRAAQFSPFAALTGFGASIQETARLTHEKLELEEPEVAVTYFCPDARKSGGAYVTADGTVQKIDLDGRRIVMADGTAIAMDDILDIAGALFAVLP